MAKNDSALAVAVASFTVALMTMEEAKKKADAALSIINQSIMSSLNLKDEKGWLTEAGKATLRHYWEAEMPVKKASELMDISYSAARTYFMRWNEEWDEANAA
jgi:hypothetical protein